MKKKGRFDKSVLILFAIIVIIIITALYIFCELRVSNFKKKILEEKEISFIVNINEGKKLLFSEIFTYHPVTGKSAIIDIPGNYGSLIKSLDRFERIDFLYKKERPEQYIKKVQIETGLEIPFYMNFSLEEVERNVDILSGLEMFLINSVEEKDEKGGFYLLPSGGVVLDGEKISEYIHYSEKNSKNINFAEFKQKFIKSFMKRIGEKSAFLLNKRVFKMFYGNADTNLTAADFKIFINDMRKIDFDRVIFQRVLGDEKYLDNDVVLLFPHYDGNMFRESIKQTIGSLSNITIPGNENMDITLDILNGTSLNGLASRTSVLYKNFGYSVKSVRNAENPNYAETVFIGHKNGISNIQKSAGIIKCSNIVFWEDSPEFLKKETDLNKAENADIIIILGKDFDGRYCK